jgi:hypothetical protein
MAPVVLLFFFLVILDPSTVNHQRQRDDGAGNKAGSKGTPEYAILVSRGINHHKF